MNESIKEKIKAVVIDRSTDVNVFSIIGLNLLEPLVKSLGIDLTDAYFATKIKNLEWHWTFKHNDVDFVLSGGVFSNNIAIVLDDSNMELDD